jgi:tRNA pseudouridine55 synthase
MSTSGNKDFDAGLFLVDKPPGLTSFRVVSKLRHILKIKKVGHAGTLDPFATGLLVVCAGRAATRLISRLMDGEKEYQATVRLGIETDTCDIEGETVRQAEVGHIDAHRLEQALHKFRGRQLQTPPAYSALKHKGKPLYYYARRGITVSKEPREIEISVLERTDGCSALTESSPDFSIRVVCSKGTYIRTLGADIGAELGCGAHLCQLRRSRSGCFSLDDSLSWADLNAENSFEQCMKKMLSVEQVGKLLQ